MYLPAAFRVDDIGECRRFVRRHPLATLILAAPGGISADHLPLVWQENSLFGHFARANPAWRHAQEAEVLAVFQSAGHYISANWYPGKQRHHQAVPTWNYQAVHIRGRMQLLEDAAEARHCLAVLTAQMESREPRPWTLNDAPAAYIDKMLRAVCCFRIRIGSVQGKYKLSQNQSAENRAGVCAALHNLHTPAAEAMAQSIARHQPED